LAKHHRDLFGEAVGWIALGGFAVLSALLTGIGRSSQGVAQAASSRYFTASTLFPLATLALALMVVGTWEQRRPLALPDRAGVLAIAGVVLAGVLATGYHAGFEGFDYRHQVMGVVRYCEVHATSREDPCLTGTYPLPDVVWQWLEYLRTHHLAGLAPLPPPPSGSGGAG
jgi:hypothetical protein